MELPTRLTRCVELEAYGQAVTYYKKTSGILKKYSNLPSFQAIEKDVGKIITVIKEKLTKSIADPRVCFFLLYYFIILFFNLFYFIYLFLNF